MGDNIQIRVEGVWKRYGGVRADLKRYLSLWPNHFIPRPDQQNNKWVLRDINLEVRQGQTIGIVGQNGSGKSTLLKLLAGVSPATYGRIEVRGRVFPMIELNAGLHPYLTGRQNVRLLGTIMGLSSREVQNRMSIVEEFCELGDYFNQPVRTYSSGMMARLSFGVAVNIEADILLVDEVLAVGDLGFQKKCFDKIEASRQAGVTVILVSHRIRQIQRLCDQVIWLEKGQEPKQGESEAIIQLYTEYIIRKRASNIKGMLAGIWQESGEMTVLSVKLFDYQGCERDEFATFESLKIQVEYEASQPLSDLILGFNISTADMILVHSLLSERDIPDLSLPAGPGLFACTIAELHLLPGPYFLSIRVKDKGNRTLLHGERVSSFIIRPTPETQINVGLVYTSAHWELDQNIFLA